MVAFKREFKLCASGTILSRASPHGGSPQWRSWHAFEQYMTERQALHFLVVFFVTPAGLPHPPQCCSRWFIFCLLSRRTSLSLMPENNPPTGELPLLPAALPDPDDPAAVVVAVGGGLFCSFCILLQIFLCGFQSAFWHSFEQYDTLRHPEQRRRSVATVKQCAHLVSAMDFGFGGLSCC